MNTTGQIGTAPYCKHCGSERVALDAWACWNRESGLWELEHVFDDAHCHACEGQTKLLWRKSDSTRASSAIQELNDRFRKIGQGNGTVLITAGLKDQGDAFLRKAMDAVQKFNSFSEDNDPWGEHDFGAIDIDGEKIFWKIDCYDPTMTQGSENPANEALTHRVLTIMLAREY